MTEVLFNFHDVILLMTAMQCLFFAVLLLATNTQKLISTYFLAAFLLTHSLIPLHELTLWGAIFKFKIRNVVPELYFLGGFAYYLDAVFLYFCVKSLMFRDFILRKRDALHLVPIILFGLFMYLSFYRLPGEERLALITTETFVYEWQYILVDLLCKSMRVGYCLFCLVLITRYKRRLESTHSHVQRVDVTWLSLLVIGLLVVMSMELLLSLSKMIALFQHYDPIIFENIGLTGYYSMFFLVNLLVFTGIRYFASFQTVKQKDSLKKTPSDALLNPELAQTITQTMVHDKPYIQPDITLDHLAEQLDMPAKDLSMIINRHFGTNFYEFINRYRIDEARKILTAPDQQQKSITDIYLAVGFNSKSVFNTFFKKLTGMTPSQYRQDADQSAQVSSH